VGKCDGSGKRATSVDEELAASAWKRFRHLGGRYDVLSVFWFSSASEIRAMKPLLSRWWHEWKIRASSSANTRGTSSCSQSASVAYAPPPNCIVSAKSFGDCRGLPHHYKAERLTATLFAARCYAQARPMPSCAVSQSICPSVCVRLSCSYILSKRINVFWKNFHRQAAT